VAGNTTHKNYYSKQTTIIGRAIHNHYAIYYAKSLGIITIFEALESYARSLAIITAFNSIYKVTLSPL